MASITAVQFPVSQTSFSLAGSVAYHHDLLERQNRERDRPQEDGAAPVANGQPHREGPRCLVAGPGRSARGDGADGAVAEPFECDRVLVRIAGLGQQPRAFERAQRIHDQIVVIHCAGESANDGCTIDVVALVDEHGRPVVGLRQNVRQSITGDVNHRKGRAGESVERKPVRYRKRPVAASEEDEDRVLREVGLVDVFVLMPPPVRVGSDNDVLVTILIDVGNLGWVGHERGGDRRLAEPTLNSDSNREFARMTDNDDIDTTVVIQNRQLSYVGATGSGSIGVAAVR